MPNEPTLTTRHKRLILGLGGPVLAAGLIIGPILLFSDLVPEPLAIGWDATGQSSNSSSLNGYIALQSVLAVLCSIGFVIGSLRPFARPITNGVAAIAAGVTMPVFAANSIATMAANNAARSWTEVDSPGLGWLALTVLSALGGLALVGWLTRDLYVTAPAGLGYEPSAGLTITESQAASWHSQASARWPMYAALTLLAVGIAVLGSAVRFAGTAGVVIAAIIVGVGAVALAFARIDVTVDRRGLTVAYGKLPWPRSHVDIESISAVEAIDVNPRDHGGWGYRGSRVFLGKAAVVIRRGEGIRLTLDNGTEFVVTVDDAEQGAGVLNDLRHA